ncbi:transcription termination factor 1, mitochondrial [Gouania willdenowi]|uniref:Mitochondrial transcription termination factor n=1 Tax=Gouania willdenowi TaxID=441366 RepID=A0A8C5DH85_GOUWI|nr:transcription termination factor 1, mitochondrial [Gouania willdenowi]
MAASKGLRVFLSLHRSLTFQSTFPLVSVQLSTNSLSTTFCCSAAEDGESNRPASPENESLVDSLSLMGVDTQMAQKRQPGVFRRVFTNEQGLATFLHYKGASCNTIASVISRYPRSITRSISHLDERWTLWRKIIPTDAEILSILDRSPESFFRSSDNESLEKNMNFLISLGLDTKDIHRLLTIAPRTFSNSLELNKQRVEFLEGICVELGGKNPQQFVKNVISKNLYILIRSTKRVRMNIDHLRASLKLNNSELLSLLEGVGAEILYLSNEYLKNSCSNLQQTFALLGSQNADIKKLILKYPVILKISQDTLSSKLDCLLKAGITMKQIIEKPKVLDYSTQNITAKINELEKVGYDFQTKGIQILDMSQKRFIAKIKRLGESPEE